MATWEAGYKAKKIRGANKLRRVLKRLEKDESEAVKKALRHGAEKVKADAIGYAILKDIKLTGEMIRSIDTKYSSDKFSVMIGPGVDRMRSMKNNPWNTSGFRSRRADTILKDNEAQWNFMKAWWAEFGTGPPIEQDPKPFMNPAWDNNRNALVKKINQAVVATLRRASRE